MVRNDAVQVIIAALRTAVEPGAADAAFREDTVLYGAGGRLDSLGLVSLILEVEAAVNAETGQKLVLADAHAMSQKRSPFRNVGSLADYVIARLEVRAQCQTDP